MTAASSATLELLLATVASQKRAQIALNRLSMGIVRQQALLQGKVKRHRSARLIVPRGQATLSGAPELELPSRPSLPPVGTLAEPKEAAPPVQIRCFGRFEVACQGVPVQHWRRSKAKTLLKYLVVHRHAVPRDELLDLLWPECDPELAINSLRVVLHALRQVLGPVNGDGPRMGSYVIVDGGSYHLNREARLWVDADEFTLQFEAGLRLERQGQVEQAKHHFELAEVVYRDDYLLEDIYEDWTLLRREEFKDRYLMVLTKLADYCLQRGDAEGGIVRCHKILQKDPCREDAYRRLMRCHAMLGQRSQAMQWYNHCVRTLRQEFNVGPSAPTLHLYEQISLGK